MTNIQLTHLEDGRVTALVSRLGSPTQTLVLSCLADASSLVSVLSFGWVPGTPVPVAIVFNATPRGDYTPSFLRRRD